MNEGKVLMLLISDIKMDVEHSEQDLVNKVSKLLKTDVSRLKDFRIRKKSLDARDKKNIRYVYSIEVCVPGEDRYLNRKNISKAIGRNENTDHTVPISGVEKTPLIPIQTSQNFSGRLTWKQHQVMKRVNPKYRPVIAGSGPAGLFCGLLLAEAGMRPIILERGADVDTRRRDVDLFFKTGVLNEKSNIQFGEGGAGTFSDGKLTTGVKDTRISYILQTFVEHGAPSEILYESKPHIGTDHLAPTVKNIRMTIESLGGEVRFNNKLTGIKVTADSGREAVCGVNVETEDGSYFIETDTVVMAIGHSARDTVEMLYGIGLLMKPKSFSVGFRIEHRREFINSIQYGVRHNILPAADYKLAVRLANGRGAYTFCMCPGGVVVAASSEKGRLAVNGMSRYARDADNSNSAVLISVTPEDFSDKSPLGGVEFQREWETAAFNAGGGNFFAPSQTVGDFLRNKKTVNFGCVTPSYKPSVTPVNFYEHFDKEFLNNMSEAILKMDTLMGGFADEEATLTGIESRSSSPVTVLRGESYEANILGIYPCGEGCGHAGGIISAAVDGMKCAEAVLKNHLN